MALKPDLKNGPVPSLSPLPAASGILVAAVPRAATGCEVDQARINEPASCNRAQTMDAVTTTDGVQKCRPDDSSVLTLLSSCEAHPVPVLPINDNQTCGKDMGRKSSSIALDHGHKVDLLQAGGFTVEPYLADMEPPMVPAHKPGCRLLAGRSSPLGWHRGVLASLVQPDERLFFVYGGQTYSEQPVLRTILAHHVARICGYFGLPGTEEPVIAVIAERGCDELAIRYRGNVANP